MRVGDWFDLSEGATALVLAVAGGGSLTMDPYDPGAAPTWMDLKGRDPMDDMEVERRVRAMENSIKKASSERLDLVLKMAAAANKQAREASILRIVKTLTMNRT